MKTGMIPLCEFRLKRTTNVDEGNIETEFVCQAAGGEHLGWVGGDQGKLIAACSECIIPEVIAHDSAACYFLRPLRLIDDGLTFLPCRNFCGFLRKRYPVDMSECRMCQFWFPRPPLANIKCNEQDTQQLLINVQQYLHHNQQAEDTLQNNKSSWCQKMFAYLRLLFVK
jgi:hypothetical protein